MLAVAIDPGRGDGFLALERRCKVVGAHRSASLAWGVHHIVRQLLFGNSHLIGRGD